jgi:hypothetical protein
MLLHPPPCIASQCGEKLVQQSNKFTPLKRRRRSSSSMLSVFFFTSLILQHGTLNPKPCASVFCSSLVPIVSFLAFWYLDDDFFLLL